MLIDRNDLPKHLGGHDVPARLRPPGDALDLLREQIRDGSHRRRPRELLLLVGQIAREAVDAAPQQPGGPIGALDPLREIAYSIDHLGVDYVDLYLVHWPAGGATWAWPEMEHARERSYTRSIGVSNFDARELREVMAVARTPPVVDKVEFNPFASW